MYLYLSPGEWDTIIALGYVNKSWIARSLSCNYIASLDII